MKNLQLHVDQKNQALNFFNRQNIQYKIIPTLKGSLIVEFEFQNNLSEIELKMIYNALK